MDESGNARSMPPWRERLHEVIFEADTPSGKLFDVVLLWAILASVTAVCLESVAAIRARFGFQLWVIEWVFTILFTIEYVLRLICVYRPTHYARSFFGIVDVAAILPTYLSLLLPRTQSLIVIRALRLLRVFRVLKLMHFVFEARQLREAVRASARKIIVFVGAVMTIVLITGAMMYIIEGPTRGFSSIPRSMYWAIVTMTTVGYGDIAPQTVPGQVLASILMICGYGIIAVPTGIVSAEFVYQRPRQISTQACRSCGADGHDADARHCKYCGVAL
ncbi:MAG: ion transporter [Acidobacteriota bacterium]|nr:MAG: ion transporter [Acidobacteriota bacterium]